MIENRTTFTSCMSMAALAAVTIAVGLGSHAEATVVQTDFNSQSIGALKTQAAVGTGLTGIWSSGSSVPDVFAGDLTAPAGTGFNITQSAGNGPQSVRFDNVERQNGVDLTTSLTGTVWGSFLVNTNNGGTAGIGVNSVVTFASLNGRPELLASGTGLVFDPNDGLNPVVSIPGVLPASGDSLILFKMVFDGATGFTVRAWANPDLTIPLPVADLSAVSSNADALSFDRLGVGGARLSSGLNSYIDMITLSDGPNAIQDVTGGVPEPASLALIGLGGLVICSRRH